MKTKSALLTLALLAGLATSTLAQTPKSDLSVEEGIVLNITAKVQAIDHEKREVTLKGPLGNEVTFTVDQRVKRLNEVKVGDDVTADYYVSLAAELRKPTPEEEKEPLVILDAKARAPKDTTPAGGQLRMFKVVTTVEGLERPTRLITLKGPRGNYVSVRARDLQNLEMLRLGDTVVVTYTEALAISLEKAAPKTPKG
jgi:hypothetical protein